MSEGTRNIRSFADRLQRLADDYKADVDVVLEDAKKADIDPGALRRLVSWLRMDEVTRAEREAIDEQYRFLAGELAQPAALPTEANLTKVVELLRQRMTVRQIAKELGVSVGKAHKLKVQAAAFTVHDGVNMNTPPHDEQTGEIRDTLILDAASEMEAEVQRELRDALNLSPVDAGGMSSASPSKAIGEVTSTCGGANSTHSGEASGSAEPKTAESSCGLSDDKPVSNPAPQGPITNKEAATSSGDAGSPGIPSAAVPSGMNVVPPLGRVSANAYADKAERSGTNPDDDGLTIPHFLRRPKQEASV
jgi:uncharacterized protein (UPF0335 family)